MPCVTADHALVGGLGLHMRLIDGWVVVLDVWDPALRARDIAPGMEIARIDGQPGAALGAVTGQPNVTNEITLPSGSRT
jgi:hypothetical protein